MILNDIFALLESFDHVPQSEWSGQHAGEYYHGNFNAQFHVGAARIMVHFEQSGDPDHFNAEVWTVSFRQAGSGFMPMKNMGETASLVLGGVVSCVRDFIRSHDPDALGWTGKDSQGLGKLYRLMAAKLKGEARSLGYDMMVTQERDQSIILMHRLGSDPQSFV